MKKSIIILFGLLFTYSLSFTEIHDKEGNSVPPVGNKGITYSYGPQWGNNIHYPNQSQNLPIYPYDYDRNGDGIPWTGTIIPSMDSPELEWLSADGVGFSRGSLWPPQEKVTNLQTHNLEVGESYDFCVCSASGGSGGQINVVTWCCLDTYSRIIPFPIENLNVDKIGGTGRNVLLTWDLPNYNGCDIDYFALLRSQTAIVDTNYKNADIVRANLPNNITEFSDTTNFGYIQSFYAVAGYDSNNGLLALSESLQPEFIPQTFSLIFPEDDSIITDSLITFQWEEQDGFEYDLLISNNSSFDDSMVFSSIQDTFYTLIDTLIDHCFYYWKIRAYQPGESDTVWSSQTAWRFGSNRQNNTPCAYNIISPNNGVTLQTLRPEFLWETSSDPGDNILYTLKIGFDSSFDSVAVYDSLTQTKFYTPFDLPQNTTLYWKVTAYDSEGEWLENSNGVFQFSCDINDSPTRFSKIYPNENEWDINSLTFTVVEANAQPTFQWHTSTDPDGGSVSYTVLLDTSATFGTAEIYDNIQDTAWSYTGMLEENEVYFWDVYAVDSDDDSTESYGRLWTFVVNETDEPPLPFSLISPTDTLDNVYVNFNWEQAVDPDPHGTIGYDLWLGQDSTFSHKKIYDFLPYGDYSETGYQIPYYEPKWIKTDFNSYEGLSWWCGNEGSNQYQNNWVQSLISREIDMSGSQGNVALSFKHNYIIEEGWDAGVLRVSNDGGLVWDVIYPSVGQYNNDNLWAFTYNGLESMPGYSGNSNGWIDAEFDLSSYSGDTIQIQFLFASDEYVTDEGWHIDNIVVTADDDTLLFDDGGDTEEHFEGMSFGIIRGMTYYWKVKANDRYSGEESDYTFSTDIGNFQIKHFPSLSGYAFLYNSDDNSGIKVLLHAKSALAVSDSTFTDNSGYYLFPEVEPGTYDVFFSKESYFSIENYEDVYIYPEDIILDEITLINQFPQPTSLSVDLVGDEVVLSWVSPQQPHITSFYIYSSITSGSGYEIIDSTDSETLTFTDIITGNYTTYYYVVTAKYYNSYESEYSNEVSATPWYNGPVCYVSTQGVDSTGYGSYEHPLATIQQGILTVDDGDTVLVLPGTYIENINYNGINITIASLFLTTQDTSYISQTIIDGNQSGSVVPFHNGEDSTAVLCGFTITNGYASEGGGISFGNNSCPSLENVMIMGNSAYYRGGGIYCSGSSPTFTNVIITGNSANQRGGGIYCRSNSNLSLENVTVTDNSSYYLGGGICCWSNSSPILENVTIANNSAYYRGGGIYCYYSSPSLINSIVSNNNGNYGIYVYSGSPTITYSDFWNNENGNFYNCGTGVGVNVTTNANGDSCDVYYNIQMDPLFVDPANEDYHLTENSPCIDAGNPASPLDPDDTIADMGAYYFHHTIVLDPLQNVTIEIIGTDVHISWDSVTGANSYKIYASDNPYTGFDSLATVADTIWSTSISEAKKFYYVTASTETIRSKDTDSKYTDFPGRELRGYDSNKFIKRTRK